MKKFLTAALSAVLMFGTVAALPADSVLNNTPVAGAAEIGDPIMYTKTWGYKFTTDGTELVEYLGDKSATSLTIPEKVDGHLVTIVGATALEGMTKLKTLTLSSGIGWNFAADCVKDCSSLTTINVSKDNEKLRSYDGALCWHTFFNGQEMAMITCIPPAKETLTIPSGLNIVWLNGADYYCTKLKEINVEEGESNIWSYDGVVYYKNTDSDINITNALSVIPNAKTELYIPSTVDYISEEQFKNRNIKTIYGAKGSAAETYAKEHSIKFVAKNDLFACKATIPYASYTYRGRGIKPTVTVKDANGKKLTKGTDYTVSYKNNTNVGTATITIKGKGSYFGELKKTFKVKPLDLTSSYAKVTIPYSSYTYTGSQIKPTVKVKFKDGDIIPATQYTVSYSDNTKVGVATITVKGTGKNTTGTYKKTFVVKPAKNAIKSISSTKGAFKITWNKATAGATGYQVQYSTDKNFKTNVHSYTSTNLSDLSENFSSVPKSGETWYVKVRSFVTKDGKASSTRYGNYSDVKTIKVK